MCGWCFSKVKPHRKNGHHQAYPRLRSTFTQRQDMTGQTQQHCQRKFASNFWATDECPWWALSLCPVACEYAVTPWKRANPFVLHVIIVALGVAQVGCVSAGAGLVDLEEPSTSAPDCSSWKRNKWRGIGNRTSFGRCGQKKTHETVAKSRLPKKNKTRCSPRAQMLTRMFMVQMSKHMDMQSRRTLFWNNLFEQSCAFFPCYHTSAP